MCLTFIVLGTEKILLIILCFLEFNQFLISFRELFPQQQKIARSCYQEGTLYHFFFVCVCDLGEVLIEVHVFRS